ncbi:AAA family ATPase [Candidatus Poribacteria bacterium]|nr:AAA family ATPase [Candidatus Poribacteria bacterium]MYH84068.1 AAA family ATPase [Candidatus Poribacteria bacterium]MYK94909.1 AAA family ATPase [Candidatus Poribacteria bacterium]
MRSFETRGPVYPEDNYVVARTDELSDFINRLEKGRYVVLFAPRQTGKTTFFHRALEILSTDVYFPIRIDFQASNNLEPAVFYQGLYEDICEEIEAVFQKRSSASSPALTGFLDNTQITNHLSMRRFFRRFSNFLEHHHNRQKIVLIIDEFDGIPRAVLSDFLYSLRHIYLSGRDRCPHSVGIVGVKSITQLNYDRSISPFNIQDEFKLPNFTLEQVRELLSPCLRAGSPIL